MLSPDRIQKQENTDTLPAIQCNIQPIGHTCTDCCAESARWLCPTSEF